MAKIGNLKCKVGTYMKDGQEKGKYVDVGVLMQGQDGGMFVLLNTTFNPAGVPNPDNKESVLVSVFQDNQQSGNQGYQANQNYQPEPQQNSNQNYQRPPDETQNRGANAPVHHEQYNPNQQDKYPPRR